MINNICITLEYRTTTPAYALLNPKANIVYIHLMHGKVAVMRALLDVTLVHDHIAN